MDSPNPCGGRDPVTKGVKDSPEWEISTRVAEFHGYSLEVNLGVDFKTKRNVWDWDACIMGMSMPSDKTRMSGYTSAKRAMRAAEAWVLRQPEVRAQRALSNTRTTS
jgi:hypothetical protein